METQTKVIISSIVGFFVLLLILVLSPFAIVDPGHRGIVTRFGTVSDTVLTEGFHWIHPFDDVKEISVRTEKVETAAASASRDLQTVETVIALNYHLKPEAVNTLYKNVGLNYETVVLSPAIQDSVKAVTARYTADELITKRSAVSSDMEALLKERLNQFAVVESISITNFDFSDSFKRAIEAKVTAEQEALASKNKLEQTKYEAEQRIVQAKAEAESIRIQAAALNENKGLVELEAVRKWSGVLPIYMGGSSVPFLNIDLK